MKSSSYIYHCLVAKGFDINTATTVLNVISSYLYISGYPHHIDIMVNATIAWGDQLDEIADSVILGQVDGWGNDLRELADRGELGSTDRLTLMGQFGKYNMWYDIETPDYISFVDRLSADHEEAIAYYGLLKEGWNLVGFKGSFVALVSKLPKDEESRIEALYQVQNGWMLASGLRLRPNKKVERHRECIKLQGQRENTRLERHRESIDLKRELPSSSGGRVSRVQFADGTHTYDGRASDMDGALDVDLEGGRPHLKTPVADSTTNIELAGRLTEGSLVRHAGNNLRQAQIEESLATRGMRTPVTPCTEREQRSRNGVTAFFLGSLGTVVIIYLLACAIKDRFQPWEKD